VYEPGSPSRDLINSIFDSYYLVNLVHNDYRHPDRLAIFSPFVSGKADVLTDGVVSKN
jgi:methylenetetrahydrofolate reductase (NADPH)